MQGVLPGRSQHADELQDDSDGGGELYVEEDDRDRNETRTTTIWLPEKEREWVRYLSGFRYQACIDKGRGWAAASWPSSTVTHRQGELWLGFSSDQRGNEEGFVPSIPERGYGVDECECEREEWVVIRDDEGQRHAGARRASIGQSGVARDRGKTTRGEDRVAPGQV
jgi:hypothetical protein